MPWQLVDYQVFALTGTFGPDPLGFYQAVCDLSLPAVAGGQIWRIERISVQLNYDPTPFSTQQYPEYSPFPCNVGIYDQLPSPTVVPADGTVLVPPIDFFGGYELGVSASDFADEGAPVTVQQGNQLTVRFTPAQSGPGAIAVGPLTRASARIQAQIFSGVAAAAGTPVAGSQPAPQIPANL